MLNRRRAGAASDQLPVPERLAQADRRRGAREAVALRRPAACVPRVPRRTRAARHQHGERLFRRRRRYR